MGDMMGDEAMRISKQPESKVVFRYEIKLRLRPQLSRRAFEYMPPARTPGLNVVLPHD